MIRLGRQDAQSLGIRSLIKAWMLYPVQIRDVMDCGQAQAQVVQWVESASCIMIVPAHSCHKEPTVPQSFILVNCASFLHIGQGITAMSVWAWWWGWAMLRLVLSSVLILSRGSVWRIGDYGQPWWSDGPEWCSNQWPRLRVTSVRVVVALRLIVVFPRTKVLSWWWM